ncbi:unnamed protein product, partial [Timema podura]|nr:unnamed protein product [Timema podura]
MATFWTVTGAIVLPNLSGWFGCILQCGKCQDMVPDLETSKLASTKLFCLVLCGQSCTPVWATLLTLFGGMAEDFMAFALHILYYLMMSSDRMQPRSMDCVV